MNRRTFMQGSAALPALCAPGVSLTGCLPPDQPAAINAAGLTALATP